MSMMRGHKTPAGYATVDPEFGGLDYRTISETMCANGHDMNHSTVRNTFLKAMTKIADEVCKIVEHDSSTLEIERIAKHPMFQTAIRDIMHDYKSA